MSHDYTKSPTQDNKLETLGLFSFDTLISTGDKYGLHPDPDRFEDIFYSVQICLCGILFWFSELVLLVYAQSYKGKAVRSKFPKRWKFERFNI